MTDEELLTRKLLIRQCLVEADIHPFVKGVSFGEVWVRRVQEHIGDTPNSFASLGDLIRMKEPGGRPKDYRGSPGAARASP